MSEIGFADRLRVLSGLSFAEMGRAVHHPSFAHHAETILPGIPNAEALMRPNVLRALASALRAAHTASLALN